MNLDRRMAVANGLILTLLGRAVSEHEAQMNSVHLFQGDCHLGDSSCYYLTSRRRIHTTLPFHLTPVFVCFLFVFLNRGQSSSYIQTTTTYKEIE